MSRREMEGDDRELRRLRREQLIADRERQQRMNEEIEIIQAQRDQHTLELKRRRDEMRRLELERDILQLESEDTEKDYSELTRHGGTGREHERRIHEQDEQSCGKSCAAQSDTKESTESERVKVLRERQRMLERELKLNLKVIEGSIGSVQEIDIGNSPEYVNSHRTDSKRNMNTRGTVESEKDHTSSGLKSRPIVRKQSLGDANYDSDTDNSDVEHEKQTLRTREVELQHRTVTATTPLRSRIEALKRQGVVMSPSEETELRREMKMSDTTTKYPMERRDSSVQRRKEVRSENGHDREEHSSFIRRTDRRDRSRCEESDEETVMQRQLLRSAHERDLERLNRDYKRRERRLESDRTYKIESQWDVDDTEEDAKRQRQMLVSTRERELEKQERDFCRRKQLLQEQEDEKIRTTQRELEDIQLSRREQQLEKWSQELQEREMELARREQRVNAEDDIKPRPLTYEREPQTDDKMQYSYPKFTIFSGEEPKPKTEATYEEWAYEVNCIRKEDVHLEYKLAQAIRKSLRGQAKRVVMPLGTSATVEEMVVKLEKIFGNVASGESILQSFYLASQRADESVAAWGLRLEEILQVAIKKGHIEPEKKNGMLRSKFWKALKSEKLKNATRVYFETTKDFENLRREVRAEEHEMKLAATGVQHRPVNVQDQKEDSKLDLLMKKINDLEKQMQQMNNQNRDTGTRTKKEKRQQSRKQDLN